MQKTFYGQTIDHRGIEFWCFRRLGFKGGFRAFWLKAKDFKSGGWEFGWRGLSFRARFLGFRADG